MKGMADSEADPARLVWRFINEGKLNNVQVDRWTTSLTVLRLIEADINEENLVRRPTAKEATAVIDRMRARAKHLAKVRRQIAAAE